MILFTLLFGLLVFGDDLLKHSIGTLRINRQLKFIKRYHPFKLAEPHHAYYGAILALVSVLI